MSFPAFTTTAPPADASLSWKMEYSEEGSPVSDVEMDPEAIQAILMSVPKETKNGLRHSASCQKILAHVDVEIEISLTTTEQLLMSCPHEGCQDVLKDVKSLKMHLAIHEIAKEVDKSSARNNSMQSVLLFK